MKFTSLLIILIVAASFSGYLKNDITKEECLKQGMKFTVEKKFNYRLGKYEHINICYS